MKRLILGIAAFAFLSFVGVQTLHRHEKIALDSCDFCLLGDQAVRHTPSAAPATVATEIRENVFQAENSPPELSYHGETSARAPPLS